VCEFYAPCLLLGQGLRRGSLVRMRPEGVEGGRIVGAALAQEGA